jgi:hypothetical protein
LRRFEPFEFGFEGRIVVLNGNQPRTRLNREFPVFDGWVRTQCHQDLLFGFQVAIDERCVGMGGKVEDLFGGIEPVIDSFFRFTGLFS